MVVDFIDTGIGRWHFRAYILSSKQGNAPKRVHFYNLWHQARNF